VEIPGVDLTETYVEGPFQEIHTGILNLLPFKRMCEDDEGGVGSSASDYDMDAEKEHLTLLLNLVLF
jgi:hypothetical protein